MSTSFVNTLLRRSEDAASSNSTIVQLLTALVVLAGLGLLLGGILVVIRRVKSKNSPTLPTHTRNLTVTAIPYSSSKRTSWFGNEKSDRPGTPTSPVPEIRITFPEEESADGKRKSGRVVVVQVGEAGAAFVRDIEPDNLPPYQKGGFSSVDLSKVGGLKEKEWA
ncbi:hypothetical protein TWF173_009905 [Orbilia oligospora]|uniref:Uncharacterized protein n=2 Tax=Orbilia oligospora TaxID=2813651 RepID=G1X9J6_ARTOA|nr:hypothetical protein AOL_s00076g303 [Orbilia oligospora ATCC 24927]EGX50228.1 hypothetical protein AOL_s00076g303 [Orbilia oligospora ATCC 24927]KAF3273232.1 hypothetical protein TWF970_009268 [Orbilia oligospora]KAF3310320.1 hypothetical protein TWF173_009905 [Orbilia oligospora]